MSVRAYPSPLLVAAAAVALLAALPGAPSEASLGRLILSDDFEGDLVGAPPSRWQILTIPPFNDNHSTRWAVESNAAPVAIPGGGLKSLSWDDVPSKPTDPVNPDGSTRDDFPLGAVYHNPPEASDRPGNVSTYTFEALTHLEDVGPGRIGQNAKPFRDEAGDLITYGSLVGATLWPPGASRPCPPEFGDPGDSCAPAAAVAGGIVLNDGRDISSTADDRVEVGVLYVAGMINQNDITRSGFTDVIVPVRATASISRAQLFAQSHTIQLFVSQNRYVGIRVDGVFYGWGEVRRPDGSPVLIPLSDLTGYAIGGVVRNHTHYDNVRINAGLPDGLPPTTPTPTPPPSPTATPTPTPSPTPTPTRTPAPTPTATPTPTPTPTPSPAGSPPGTPAPTPTPPPGGAVIEPRDADRDGVLGSADTSQGRSIHIDVAVHLGSGQSATLQAQATDSAGASSSAGPVSVQGPFPRVPFDLDATGLADGPVLLQVTGSVDGAPAIDARRTVTLDRVPPHTTITTPDGQLFWSVPFAGLSDLVIEGTASDGGSGVRVVALLFRNLQDGRVFGPYTAVRSGPATSQTWRSRHRVLWPGSYEVEAYALDEAMNLEVAGRPRITIVVI